MANDFSTWWNSLGSLNPFGGEGFPPLPPRPRILPAGTPPAPRPPVLTPPGVTVPPLTVPGGIGGLPIPKVTTGRSNMGAEFPIPQPGPYPQPPVLSPPPAPAGVEDFDPDLARKALQGAAPQAPDYGALGQANTANILAGLAKGAGGVSATEPGSFAKALAGWGGGGAEARAKGLAAGEERGHEYAREKSAFQTATAKQELDIAKQESDVRDRQQAVAQSHADQIWKTGIENQKAQYEAQLAEYKLKAPQVHNVPGGFVTTDPSTGQGKFWETKTTIEKADTLRNTLKALTPGDPLADVQAASLITHADWPPDVKIAAMKEYLVRGVTGTGQGQAMFGKVYEQAYKTISDRMNKDKNFEIVKVQKPAEFVAEIQRQTSAELMRLLAGNDKWVYELAKQGNPLAKAMTGGQ